MTKSQNTKNEQQKDLCITSEQLTEQWKKGELILDKSYYLRLQDGSEEVQMYVGGFLCNENNPVKEVLAPVPNYEEWQSMDRLEKIMLQERSRLNKQVIELLEENTKLKELLKECRAKLNYCTRETYELQTKINQALGEE